MRAVQGEAQFAKSVTDTASAASHQRAHPDTIVPDGFGQVM